MTDGRPFCCACYERLYAAKCVTCRQTIHVTDGHMVHGSRRWHAVDLCFRCDACAVSLLGCPFVAIPGKDTIYCADCGVARKAVTSASCVDNCDGVVGGHYLSPSSPMMKVRELGDAVFRDKFAGADAGQCLGLNWSEESPLKVSTKCFSPSGSPLQCKPSDHTAYTDPASCCDDHRLSAEFDVCASSRQDPNDGILASEPSSQNEKSSSGISPAVNSLCDGRSSAKTGECATVSAGAAANTCPSQDLFVASIGDFLDVAEEVNAGLEELIVEPLWNHKEPKGLTADGTDVCDVPDDIRQKSRKSKNLNVRFDSSTKDPRSPLEHGRYCERWHHRSLDDSSIPYMRRGHHCHAAVRDGSASVRIRRRHRPQNDVWSDAGVRSHRASMNQHWWVDDYDHCSTCSSSSTDSDFDYGDVAAFNGKVSSLQSQTLPQRRYNASSSGAVPPTQQVQRSKKHKKKHCTVS